MSVALQIDCVTPSCKPEPPRRISARRGQKPEAGAFHRGRRGQRLSAELVHFFKRNVKIPDSTSKCTFDFEDVGQKILERGDVSASEGRGRGCSVTEHAVQAHSFLSRSARASGCCNQEERI